VWLPLLINLVVYSLGFWLAGHYFGAAMDWLLPGWLDWLRWLLWPIFAVALVAIGFFTFTVVANLIGSPFYGALSAKVSSLDGAAPPPPTSIGSVRDALAALALEMNRLGYLGLRALPILVMFPIPGINLVAAVLWMVFGAWSMALEYLSYPLDGVGLKFAAQKEFLRGRRGEVLVFGALVMAGLTLPLFNILVPPAAVAGATLYCRARKLALTAG
ncbi:MAG: sulfate transporter CysZ, partial [Methylococcaceae bacterium]|nr:sulfate transporter CysZ [Methylococcaceae bacterium]